MYVKNYIGKRFEKLLCIKRKREDNQTYYLCRCDCGNEKWVFSGSLTKGKTTSCGCERSRIVKEERDRIQKNNLIENTSVSLISREKPYKNNTSGVTGVGLEKGRNKWRAVITFQKKTYRLGYYDTLEEAAAVRKEAEGKLFGEFLEWYKGKDRH